MASNQQIAGELPTTAKMGLSHIIIFILANQYLVWRGVRDIIRFAIGNIMFDFVASLDLEIQRLEKAVEDIPEVRKLRELQRIQALYNDEIVSRVVDPLIAKYAGGPPGRKMSPQRQRALEVTAEFLADKINPMRTTTILEALAGNGITLGGNDPVNALSALLSTSGKFVAHGRSGWTLKPSGGFNVISAPLQTGSGDPGAGGAGED